VGSRFCAVECEELCFQAMELGGGSGLCSGSTSSDVCLSRRREALEKPVAFEKNVRAVKRITGCRAKRSKKGKKRGNHGCLGEGKT